MRKIIVLIVAAACMVCANSCSVQQTSNLPQRDSIAPPKKVVARQDVNGFGGLLVLHPVDNIVKGNGKSYSFFYDYQNKYLNFTDDEKTYTDSRDYLPEVINVNTLGRGIEFISMSARPFASFTKELRMEIAEKSGIDFNKINDYQIASVSSMQIVRNPMLSMQRLLDMLEHKNYGTETATDGRTKVAGNEGMLVKHPIPIIIKDTSGKNWYVFYDLINHCIYITDVPDIYGKFDVALPFKLKNGDTENAVLVQGVAIDPFVYFNQENIDAMAKNKGLEIDGGGDANSDVNSFKVLKLSAYAIVQDYHTVINVLHDKLGVQQQVAKTSDQKTQPQQQNSFTLPNVTDTTTVNKNISPGTSSNKKERVVYPSGSKRGY